MISIKNANNSIKRTVPTLEPEAIAIRSSVGRILAEDIVADMDLPPFDRSMMDGFAVRAADLAGPHSTLKVVGESAAGRGWHHELSRGEAVRIMTGAPVPKGADAVIRVEDTSENDGSVVIGTVVKRGTSIVKRGSEVRSGRVLLSKGDVITPYNIATIAAFGYAELQVYKRPAISIISTGSEIVPIAATPKQDQIRNSNSVMIASMAAALNAKVEIRPHIMDDIAKLKRAIGSASERSDMVVLTGGVSVGKYDLTKDAIIGLGGKIIFDKVRLKPGKPTVFAMLGNACVFGLPGNPVSAAVAFRLFVQAAIMRMQGAGSPSGSGGKALTNAELKAPTERDLYQLSRSEIDTKGRLSISPVQTRGSSDLASMGVADCLAVVPRGTRNQPGDIVDILWL